MLQCRLDVIGDIQQPQHCCLVGDDNVRTVQSVFCSFGKKTTCKMLKN